MTKDDEKLMERFGITCMSKTFYFYKQYRYDNLKDALNYAELDSKRTQDNTLLTT